MTRFPTPLNPLVILIMLAGSAGSAGCAADRPRQVRVITYNIHHGTDADEQPTLDRIASLIASENADIVALQEVDRAWSPRSAYRDQMAILADTLDMHAYFGHIYDFEPDSSAWAGIAADVPSGEMQADDEPGDHPNAAPLRDRRRYGLAILSRFPIVDSSNYELIRLPSIDSEPEMQSLPGFPHVTVDVDGVLLHVFNTHLDYRRDPELRRRQVEEMLEIIEPYAHPALLMGDLNAPPGAPEIQPLLDRFSDAWTRGGEGEGMTFPASDPTKRIDAIYVTPGIHVDTVYVPASMASDHRPVVAALRLDS